MSFGLGIPNGYDLTPYCGAPGGPATWMSQWNLDPYLIAVLLAVLATHQLLVGRRPRSATLSLSRPRRNSFLVGWALGLAAVISPLCPLSVSLFSARIAQHMWLVSIVAPLIAWGLPEGTSSRSGGGFATGVAAVVFAGLLWFWHAPAPYLATFQSNLVYWAMHATTFGAAVWLARCLITEAGRNLGVALAAAAFTTVQMGLLGAVITFAGHPLYAPHVLTTAAWGLTQLQDQELGGVIMWVPPGLITIGALVGGLGLAMRRALPAEAHALRA